MSLFIFRADGNSEIGLGHIMRCLSIADACRVAGHKALFVLADQFMKKLVEGRGYRVCVLNSDYRQMEKELPQMQSILYDGESDELGAVICVVDSYYVSYEYFRGVKSILAKRKKSDSDDKCFVVYLDDMAASAYPVDALINYNIYGPDKDYCSLYERESVPMPRLLLGTEFVPLREQFLGVSKKNQKKYVKDVLLSTGGSDSEHLALNLVNEIINRTRAVNSSEDYKFHILVGMANSDSGKIWRKAAGIANVIIHVNVSDMRSLIESCDIAVSAAGSTLYEISACGVPLITYVLADNQIPGAEAFERCGLAINLGDMRLALNPAGRILDAIRNLAGNYDRRVELGRRMQGLVDGRGAYRIVEKLAIDDVNLAKC